MSLSAVLSKEMAISIATKGAELSPNLVAENWTLGTGWACGTSPATLEKNASGTGTATPASQSISANGLYLVEMQVASISGSTANWTLGGVSGNAITSTGKKSQYIVASTTGKLIITPVATGLRMVIDSISIKLVTLETVGFATDFDFETNKETVDITTLEDAGWKKFLVDLKEWKVSTSGLVTRGESSVGQISCDEILSSLVGSDATMIAIIKTNTVGDQYFAGEAYLTSFKKSGSVGDKTTWSTDLQGSGIVSLLNN